MTIRVALKHETTYLFPKPVTLHPHVVRLRPAPHSRTPITAYSLKVEPEEHFLNWQQDPFGNYLARFVFPEKATRLSINVELIAEMNVINPFDFFLEESAERVPVGYDAQLSRDLAPYLEVTERGDRLRDWLKGVDRKDQGIVDFLVALNQRVQQDVGYLVRMQPGVQTCEETLGNRSGSCRDSGWLLVQILRHLGLAARFVSGYLVQLTADQKSLDGPSGTDVDFTDLHAWAEVYLPGAGWVGLDPTSGLFTGEGHIPLACTPDSLSAAPVTGSTGTTEVEFQFSNSVTRIHEDPRVTRPYTDQAWTRVLALGDQVQKELDAADVRLTMGGEPTFVSVDDMEGEEWNYTAMSPTKSALAKDVLLRLRKRFAPNAVMHFGQGKWYPGEPLPRWAMSMFWRTDGEPILADVDFITHDANAAPAPDRSEDGPVEDGPVDNSEPARQFVSALAERLGIPAEYAVPGYENALQYLLDEGQLPENVTPEDSRLDNPLERARLRKVFRGGLGTVTGFAMPLKWRPLDAEADSKAGSKANVAAGRWTTSRWPFRDGHMFLLAGDSPMGLRLPLKSLPWKQEPPEAEFPRDPFDARAPLANSDTNHQKNPERGAATETVEDREIVHTAVCVQQRNGTLFVFLPPQEELETYIALLTEVAATAKALNLPVVLEGYEPPRDPRVKILQVTPDPGVIEVNVHPATNWRELVTTTETLYEEARAARLGTEKFMLDGRHSGTGGGNHVTLGALEAVDSPFLRRPDLLRSFLTYWQRHPSLSYLFSGLFIGPTSQAPRVDEARDDNLYELEIALALLPEGESDKPWLVDRMLRNFLVDLTGNTHRAEFSIDKLYSPDGPTGRKGLVEFRAFEMPPHSRMSLVQMLLIRALLAWFWKHPYKEPLIRWGTQLHDRFMLRHFVWEDFGDVLRDLNQAGYPFASQWFEAFLEFRFPLIGRIDARSMTLEVHNGLEPWHVLGEEASAQGTSRYVDSSVERVQVRVQGLVSDRYTVLCNGRALPLRPTGEAGTYVAGVRFKAWAQHSSLHPTIGVHTPLVFDIVDTDNARSIAGASYHVSHPGGRNYNTFPLNAMEAEARRGARFFGHGGSQGSLQLKPAAPHPDQPFTLDLRIPVDL